MNVESKWSPLHAKELFRAHQDAITRAEKLLGQKVKRKSNREKDAIWNGLSESEKLPYRLEARRRTMNAITRLVTVSPIDIEAAIMFCDRTGDSDLEGHHRDRYYVESLMEEFEKDGRDRSVLMRRRLDREIVMRRPAGPYLREVRRLLKPQRSLRIKAVRRRQRICLSIIMTNLTEPRCVQSILILSLVAI